MSCEAEAFFKVCSEAEPANGHFVSLYRSIPYYGGPEEGGWWGEDVVLVASQRFATEAERDAARDRVKELAESLSRSAQQRDNEAMAASCDWLESRGLDADFLPEPAGPDRYWVAIEEVAGSRERTGSRCYE